MISSDIFYNTHENKVQAWHTCCLKSLSNNR